MREPARFDDDVDDDQGWQIRIVTANGRVPSVKFLARGDMAAATCGDGQQPATSLLIYIVGYEPTGAV